MIEEKTLKELQIQIEFYKKLYSSKRCVNKWISFINKIVSTVAAATISILLGLSDKFITSDLAKDISLILGGIITVINVWEAFFNHKALYVRATASMVECCLLKDEVDILATKNHNDISYQEIKQYHQNLMLIVKENNNLWQELKKDDNYSIGKQ